MRNFSKSKLMALRQCPKRLWLEIHRPELREDSAETEASFRIGFQVGEVAQRIYDPEGRGVVIDVQNEGFERALARSSELLSASHPVFELGLSAGGVLAFADVMLPLDKGQKRAWRMVEVKSSTSLKDHYRDDVAVQAFVAQSAGVPIKGISLAHIDNSWVYPGDGDYRGLLKENDLTEEAFSRTKEVRDWVSQAKKIAADAVEPAIDVGDHCHRPFECGFYEYCTRGEPKAEYPLHWLPRLSSDKRKDLADRGIYDLRSVPDDWLNDTQQRVKDHTLSNTQYFDSAGAAADLSPYGFPAYFLDFESIQFAVPIWRGTRPYQQICFQFSLHKLGVSGRLNHTEFLDVTGEDPSEAFAEALIDACGKKGPVFVYNAAFEKTRIGDLADRFPKLAKPLLDINDRVVDLLPVARARYYHPSQQGSWSIKKVLPAVVPELRYDDLDGVQDGGMAMEAFLEAIHPDTDKNRKAQIEQQLLAYCRLDTYAMVRLWQVFSGRTDWNL